MPDEPCPIALAVDHIVSVVEMVDLPAEGDVMIISGRATRVIGANQLDALRTSVETPV
jgi:hypothetical protein